jgi:DNA-binding MarR family transcriptional regulator
LKVSAGRASSTPQDAEGGTASVTRELAQAFFELLVRHRAGMQSRFSASGLSLPQMHVLMQVGEQPATMRELADAARLEPSNLTGIIDKLEARGLVERRATKEDRRVKIVRLTRAGTAFRKRIFDKLKEPAPWMQALPEKDQKQLLLIVKKAVVLAQAQGKSAVTQKPSQKTPP